MNINNLIRKYKQQNLTIGVLGSHSALDICRGAKDLGFKTLVVCQKGRDKIYNHYYKTANSKVGCVDECLIFNKFTDLLNKDIQRKLQKQNVIFIPHRSFEVYLNFDYKAIEEKFNIPMFGSRNLLKIEERGTRSNQYDLLKQSKIRCPKQFINLQDIDRVCLVKVLEKERGYERAFFLVDSYQDYQRQVNKKLKKGVFTKKQLKQAIIEEFIVGSQINLNYFYSPINKRLEFMGSDTRRQTNFEGITKLPVDYQKKALKKLNIQYEEAGHIAVTLIESMLDQVMEMGERFVKTSQEIYPPGIIGPFALQCVIIPGPPKKTFVVIDVSPRVPGAPGISSTPYMNYLYSKSFSIGKRIAMEIKNAVRLGKLETVLT